MSSWLERISDRTQLPSETVREALKLEERLGSGSEGDREDALCEIACRLDLTRADQAHQEDSRAPGRPVQTTRDLLPDTRVTAQALLDSLQSEIEKLRIALFKGPNPPFADDEVAAEWIRRNARTPRESPDKKERLAELLAEIQDKFTECEELTQYPWRSQPSIPVLRYRLPGERDSHCVKIPIGSPLESLKQVVDSISTRTGLAEAVTTSYVLTGCNPTISRFTIQHAVSYPGPLSRVTITFNAQNVSWDDMRVAYTEIQKARGGRATLIDAEDQAVWEAVRDLGGEPEETGSGRRWKTKKAFWAEVKRQLEERGQEGRYKDWRGPMMRWRRLMKQQPWLAKV